MKKRLLAAVMAVMCALGGTGCSNEDKPVDSTGETDVTEAGALEAAVSNTEIGKGEVAASQGKQLVIGFSQPHSTSAWRVIQTESVMGALEGAGYQVIYTDAQNNTQKQVADVEDILAQKPDYLLLAPREEDGLVPALEAAKKAGVPVILLDRKVKGEAGVDYVTFIGSDYVEAGKTVGEWILKETGGTCNIAEIAGTPGATSTIERADGFRAALQGFPEAVILGSQVGDNKRVEAQKVMENFIQAFGSEMDVVFAQSDEMAFGAIQAMKANGVKPTEDIKICSVDGTQGALEAIISGELTMSLYNDPNFGSYALDTITKLQNGEEVDTWIKVENRIFDKSNAQASLEELYPEKK